MKLLAAIVVMLATQVANAAPVEDAVRAQLLPALPPNTDVAKVHLPANLARLDVDDADVTVELPRSLGLGRKSVKVTVRGQRAVYVPVVIGELADVAIAEHAIAPGTVISADDVRVETRGVEHKGFALGGVVIGSKATRAIKAGAIVAGPDIVLPPPLPRGTQVAIVMQRGAVRIRGEGTLELVARPGETATVRLAHNKQIVRGTLVAPNTVVVGIAP